MSNNRRKYLKGNCTFGATIVTFYNDTGHDTGTSSLLQFQKFV